MTDSNNISNSEEAEEINKTCVFFCDLSDIVHGESIKQDIDENTAQKLAASIAIETAKMYAASIVYIPKKPVQLLRQIKIYREIREGYPVSEVARNNGVSEQWAYKIYRDRREKMRLSRLSKQ